MKKLLTCLVCFLIVISSIACSNVKRKYRGPSMLICGVDDFVQKLKAEDIENKDFYVLAPQYIVEKEGSSGFNVELTSTYQEKGETKTRQGLVEEVFSVCNEEKYGKQITDWGQHSGIAMNFTVKISINVDYSDKITDLKFEYCGEIDCSWGVIVEANVYNGSYCFATVELEGNGCSFENLKGNLESYLSEFLMLKSEFLEFYKQGGIKKSAVEVETLNLNETSRLWDFKFCSKKCELECVWESYADSKNTYVYLTAKPGGEPATTAPETYNQGYVGAIDVDLNGDFVEPYHYQHLQSVVKEFCNSSHNAQGNIRLDIIIIPIPSVEVDLNKITFGWWSDDVVNLYYEGYLFATATYSVCNDCTKDVTFIKTYVEQYIRDRIAKY